MKPQSSLNNVGFDFTEVRNRLLFLIGALAVFRFGSHLPLAYINNSVLVDLFKQNQDTILNLFNVFSGGSLERLSIFTLGIMPYISASIIMQLMIAIIPSLDQLRKEGEAGRVKITQYSRYMTVVIAFIQAISISFVLEGQVINGYNLVVEPGLMFRFVTVSTLVGGTLFLMWLGEQITERGIGNGISVIIFAGIVSGLPSAIGSTINLNKTGEIVGFSMILLILLVIFIVGFVVFVEKAQRRITVNYVKRQQGNRMMGSQSSYLPLKINMSGVIPPIFASSIILFPTTLVSWLSQSEQVTWLDTLVTQLAPGKPIYVILFAVLITFFAFFYTSIIFNPVETADNLKRSGAYLSGIRPGHQTANYIDGVVSRLTVVGAAYLTLVSLLPEFLIIYWNVPFYFGGTALLIIVSVVIDLMTQFQSHLMSSKYENMLKRNI